ncbi:MAG TPA: YicC/YloC family endoribonuclease [Terriglobia bacterium]|nr:YicC/YloC family endoribonuclease [Terriglobia bacterium]
MIRSMTGYSRRRREEKDFSLSVGIKSTNHRFLDLQLRLPVELEPFDPLVRRLVKDGVTRGHVEVTVGVEGAGAAELHIDEKLLGAYAHACQKLRDQYGFSAPGDPVTLLRIPGMVGAANGTLSPEALERVQQVLESLTVETLEHLNEMRAREGAALEQDLRKRLERLRGLSDGVTRLAERVPQLYQRRLETRVREMLAGVELDRGRVAQEVAHLASHSDITEELTRFRSHLDQAAHLLDESSEVGKKLDFLLQELNREANTVLSKTTDVPEVGLEIARQAIEMKTEIEKLREQAQNIE